MSPSQDRDVKKINLLLLANVDPDYDDDDPDDDDGDPDDDDVVNVDPYDDEDVCPPLFILTR